MLCPSCRRQVKREATYCTSCGAAIGNAVPPLELVLADGTRVPIVTTITIGRGAGSSVRIDDPSVSRAHARILVGDGAPSVEDAGSSHGTWVDDQQIARPVALRAGTRIRVGDVELSVEVQRTESEAGRTIVVRAGASLLMPAVGAASMAGGATSYGLHPRVRSGWALKRLDAEEGERRFVLRSLRGEDFVRMDAVDAALFELLDGRSSLVDLIAEAERRSGPAGPARLARLLADLGERGLLAGVEGSPADGDGAGRLARMLRPRERAFAGTGEWFERLYARGGWVLFTRPALIGAAVAAIAGVAAFIYLVAGRYGTPFVVADKIGLGGLVFLLGRFLVVGAHEIAHGLAMASFGRRAGKGGLKLLMVFPYAFVDTSEAWFESRRRRIAISAAGPVSDVALAGIFALACAALPAGTAREVFFQLAFGAYIGAFFNLNPFLDRDGYHIIVDALREPGLRRRSREQLARRLTGRPGTPDGSHALIRYATATIGWSILTLGFVIVMSLQYYDRLVAVAPREVVWAVLASVYLVLLIPVIAMVAVPLVMGRRSAGEVARG